MPIVTLNNSTLMYSVISYINILFLIKREQETCSDLQVFGLLIYWKFETKGDDNMKWRRHKFNMFENRYDGMKYIC